MSEKPAKQATLYTGSLHALVETNNYVGNQKAHALVRESMYFSFLCMVLWAGVTMLKSFWKQVLRYKDMLGAGMPGLVRNNWARILSDTKI